MADAISLRSYRDDQYDNDGLTISSRGSDPEHDAPPATYQQLRVQLHSRNGYATSSILPTRLRAGNPAQALHSLYRENEQTLTWRPFLSGRIGCVVAGTTVLCVVFLHGVITHRYHSSSWVATYLPSLLALVLYYICEAFGANETTREVYLVDSRCNRHNVTAKLKLISYITSLILCPLISIPGLGGYYVTNDSPWYPSGHSRAPIAAIKLEEVLPNLSYLSPLVHSEEKWNASDIWLPRAYELSPEFWSMKPNPVLHTTTSWQDGLFLPHAPSQKVLHALPDSRSSMKNSKDSDSVIGDVLGHLFTDLIDGYPRGDAVLMPVAPSSLTNVRTLSQSLIVQSQLLSIQLGCQDIKMYEKITDTYTGGKRTVQIKLSDSDGCTAVMTADGRVMTFHERTAFLGHIDMIISSFEKKLEYPPFGRDFEKVFWKFLQSMRSFVAETEDLFFFKPRWSLPDSKLTQATDVCRDRLFFLSLPLMKLANDTTGLEHAAFQSCAPWYRTTNVQAKLSVPDRSLVDIDRKTTFIQTNRPDVFDFVYESRVRERLGTPKWTTLPKQEEDSLRDFLIKNPGLLDVFHDDWPLHVLKYSLMAFQLASITGILDEIESPEAFTRAYFAPKEYAAKELCQRLSQVISTVAGVALYEERYSHTNLASKGLFAKGEPTFYYRQGSFQTGFLFMMLLYTATATVFGIYALAIYPKLHSGPSGLPWSLATLAAKIALLSRSRLIPYLSASSQRPEDLQSQPHLKIGHFALEDDHNVYIWTIDTLCRGVSIRRSREPPSKSSQRPISALAALIILINTAIALSGLLSLIFREQHSAGINPAVFSTQVEYSMYAPMFGTLENLVPPNLFSYILFVLPVILIFSLHNFCLKSLCTFYRERQPWIGLHHARSAKHNINLDYNSGMILLKSFRNRHLVVFLTSLASLLILSMPVIYAGLFSRIWLDEKMHPIMTEQHGLWKTNEVPGTSLQDMNDAISRSMLGLSSPAQLSRWLHGPFTILPINISRAAQSGGTSKENPERAAFWQFQSQALKTGLQCQEIPATIEREMVRLDDKTMWSISSARLWTNDKSYVTWPKPCHLENGFDDQNAKSQSQNHTCGRWIWVDGKWIITFLSGSATAHTRNASRLFNEEPSLLALSCTSNIARTRGTVSIISPRPDLFHHIYNAVVKTYEVQQEEPVPQQFIKGFEKLLNLSISREVSNKDTNIPLPHSSHINMASFTGDILSYMTYRYRMLAHKDDSDLTTTAVEKHVSDVFSTIFSTLVLESNTFKENQSSQIEIVPVRYTQRIYVNWTLFYVLFAFFIFTLGVIMVFARPPKRYMDFPVDVNSFEGAMFMLYSSGLLDLFRERFSAPDKMSSTQFFTAVERLSFRYRLGKVVQHDGMERWVVDREERFGDSPGDSSEEEVEQDARRRVQREPYRDEESESGSEEDEEDDEDGGLADRRSTRTLQRSIPDDEPEQDSLYGSQSPVASDDGKGPTHSASPAWSEGMGRDKSAVRNRMLDSQHHNVPFPESSHSQQLTRATVTSGRRMGYTLADFPTVKHLPDPRRQDTPHVDKPANKIETVHSSSGIDELAKPTEHGSAKYCPLSYPDHASSDENTHLSVALDTPGTKLKQDETGQEPPETDSLGEDNDDQAVKDSITPLSVESAHIREDQFDHSTHMIKTRTEEMSETADDTPHDISHPLVTKSRSTEPTENANELDTDR